MVIGMDHGELYLYDTLLPVERGELRVEDASALLGICRRQISRLLLRLHSAGPEGLISGKRGRPSNRHYDDNFRERVVAIVRDHYHDFAPSLSVSKLPSGMIFIWLARRCGSL